jgi:DNA-binding transcriptional LysR family regulator
MRFDLTDLRLFVHIGEAASITGAAARSNMAVASASERIRGMEQALGIPLLERGPRGVRLTAAGRTLLYHARTVTQQCERMRGDLGEYARGLQGHIRVLSNTVGITEFLPKPLAAFLAANKHIHVDIEEKLSHDIVEALIHGLGDIGIVSDVADLTSVEAFPFCHARLVIVLPRGHRLGASRQLMLRDISDEAFVGLSQGSALHHYVAQHSARGGHLLNDRVRLRSFDAICQMIERGVGIGIIPEAIARRCSKVMAISAVCLNEEWALRTMFICMRSFDALPIHAQRFVMCLRKAATVSAKPHRRVS